MSHYDQTSPGREKAAPGAGEAPPAPQEAAPGAASEGAPPAEDASPPSLFSGPMIILLALPILLIFLTSRSQRKKQEKLEQSIKQGDRVITRAGILGRVVEMGERSVKVEIAPGVVVQVLKQAIEAVDNPEAAKPKEADKSKDVAAKDGAAKEKAKEKAKDKDAGDDKADASREKGK